eukprot:TRINITY_DN3266_c0_g1_i2.p1 TRINITY_DN3266_c0_g1~~TRINITY_DN3266_c0_g1_i2.p1  ORF type:complete len:210 (-),score=55.68 TRINITY_DN3266_c0_g1_i2:86-646(-)
MRRGVGVGVGGLTRSRIRKEQFKKTGEDVATLQISKLQAQQEVFRKNLEEFAEKHKSQIAKDPEFRFQFQKMCSKIGVDPLASHKGFWAEMLGVGSFYYELGVQIVSVCIATRVQNGGLVGLEELLELLARLRGPRATKVTIDDVERAIQKLHVFGNGYEFVKIGDRRMLQSIPCELYAMCTELVH